MKRSSAVVSGLGLLLVAGLAYGQKPSIKVFPHHRDEVQAAPPETPTLTATDAKSENFLVAFKPGAVEACTVFRSEADTIIERDNDGVEHTIPYAPRNCWFFGTETTAYTDQWGFVLPDGGTWTIWAEVYYDQPDGTISTVKTNELKVKR